MQLFTVGSLAAQELSRLMTMVFFPDPEELSLGHVKIQRNIARTHDEKCCRCTLNHGHPSCPGGVKCERSMFQRRAAICNSQLL